MNINRLKEIREDKDLLQKDIAKLLKTTQQQYSKYELGTRKHFSWLLSNKHGLFSLPHRWKKAIS